MVEEEKKCHFSYEICCWGKSKSAKEAKEATEERDCYTDYHCKPCSEKKLDDYHANKAELYITSG